MQSEEASIVKPPSELSSLLYPSLALREGRMFSEKIMGDSQAAS